MSWTLPKVRVESTPWPGGGGVALPAAEEEAVPVHVGEENQDGASGRENKQTQNGKNGNKRFWRVLGLIPAVFF